VQLELEIGVISMFQSPGRALVQQLKDGGIAARINVAANIEDNFTAGNAAYDSIVDEMGRTSPDDQSNLIGQFERAMEIWLPELPDVPLLEWYHRLPTDTTYWTGWPSSTDPYVNGAFWHLTSPLVLNRLRPAA
jgi:hypothetical protein